MRFCCFDTRKYILLFFFIVVCLFLKTCAFIVVSDYCDSLAKGLSSFWVNLSMGVEWALIQLAIQNPAVNRLYFNETPSASGETCSAISAQVSMISNTFLLLLCFPKFKYFVLFHFKGKVKMKFYSPSHRFKNVHSSVKTKSLFFVLFFVFISLHR